MLQYMIFNDWAVKVMLVYSEICVKWHMCAHGFLDSLFLALVFHLCLLAWAPTISVCCNYRDIYIYLIYSCSAPYPAHVMPALLHMAPTQFIIYMLKPVLFRYTCCDFTCNPNHALLLNAFLDVQPSRTIY